MPPKKRALKTANLTYEHQYLQSGCTKLMGFDEAGRGTWAGPVTAAGVCLPVERKDLTKVLMGVRDSKQMTPRQRETLAVRIKEVVVAWGVGSASSTEIDELGIVPATKLAMRRAFEMANFQPDCLLLDSLVWPEMHIPQISLIKGDTLSLSIAAASVLAKVWRDDYMRAQDEHYPAVLFRGSQRIRHGQTSGRSPDSWCV